MIKLDIISDVACPWCYVGKAYLDRALERRAGHPFALEWHPFQLNPEIPADGVDRAEYMAAKFGSRENIVRIHEPLLKHAEKAGVPFDLPAIRRTPNTLNAHRLIHWAGLEGRQTLMVSRIMRAYWAEGRDIGDVATLVDLAAQIGLDPAGTERLFQTGADIEDIRSREAHSRQRGVNAVPTFIIAGKYVVQGAQPTELWLDVIDDLRSQASGTAP